eukprot:1947472-Ditylum_brightwellii.AAC.1
MTGHPDGGKGCMYVYVPPHPGLVGCLDWQDISSYRKGFVRSMGHVILFWQSGPRDEIGCW